MLEAQASALQTGFFSSQFRQRQDRGRRPSIGVEKVDDRVPQRGYPAWLKYASRAGSKPVPRTRLVQWIVRLGERDLSSRHKLARHGACRSAPLAGPMKPSGFQAFDQAGDRGVLLSLGGLSDWPARIRTARSRCPGHSTGDGSVPGPIWPGAWTSVLVMR